MPEEKSPEIGLNDSDDRALKWARLRLLNARDRAIGFTKMTAGTVLAGGGVLATVAGAGIVGIPLAFVGGLLISSGIERGITKPNERLNALPIYSNKR